MTIQAFVAAMNERDLATFDRVEASLDYGDGDPFQCVFVFQMRDGLIARETAYWTKPFPAPEWRAPCIERITP